MQGMPSFHRPSAPSARKGTRGLTLLELLTTVAILAVCLALGVPSYRHLMQRQRTDAAVHLLTSYFASARLTAVTHRKLTAVCPSDGKGQCLANGNWTHGWLMFFDPDGNRQPDDARDLLRDERSPLHPSLRVQSSSGRPQIRYLPDGRSAGSNLTVRLCQESDLLAEIVVNNAGRIRTSRPATPSPCRP